LVHLNEAKEAETHYLSQKGIEFTTSQENIGICKALNTIAEKASSDYIMYMNDDMYCLPQWDKHIADEIHHCNTTSFMFSATMIEPKNTNNKASVKSLDIQRTNFVDINMISSSEAQLSALIVDFGMGSSEEFNNAALNLKTITIDTKMLGASSNNLFRLKNI
jgi:glycosyltransferase involved in cell wall biosynthesis